MREKLFTLTRSQREELWRRYKQTDERRVAERIHAGSLGLAVGALPLFGIRKRKRVPPDFGSNRVRNVEGIWLPDAVIEHMSSTGSPKEPPCYPPS